MELELALKLLLDAIQPDFTEVGLSGAQGLCLAEGIRAPISFPPFSRSAVDGYALGAPTGDTWHIIGQVAAGSPVRRELLPGQAMLIFTGAALPEGTWGIIPREEARLAGGGIVPAGKVTPGEYIEPAGCEVGAGEEVLGAGSILGPAEIGLLAALGVRRVKVYRRPRVALICTGSELQLLHQTPAPGHIYASNLMALGAACLLTGAEVIHQAVVADELQEISSRVAEVLPAADVVLSSGGAASGDFDFAERAFCYLGGEVLFRELAMRPGRRVVAAVLEKKLLLGLPGRPAAALVAFYLLANPVFRAFMGFRPGPDFFPAALSQSLKGNPRSSCKFVWAKLKVEEGHLLATPLLNPAGVRAGVGANALVVIPPYCPNLQSGSTVRALRLLKPDYQIQSD